MIVTIDGPAGAGKSLIAGKLAERLGFGFLDTGAMYRAAALAALRANVDWQNAAAVANVVRAARFEVDGRRIALNGDDVSKAIRTSEITRLTKFVAANPLVRARLVELQRQAVGDRDFVTEGRDQGSVVFPRAECKIYLTASPEERARRRQKDLADRGEQVAFDAVLADILERDEGDAARQVGPMVRAQGAVEVVTDGLSPDEVIDVLVRHVEAARQHVT